MDANEKMYNILKDHIIYNIDHIDEETPWSESEPDWWLEMMELRRIVFRMIAKPPGRET